MFIHSLTKKVGHSSNKQDGDFTIAHEKGVHFQDWNAMQNTRPATISLKPEHFH